MCSILSARTSFVALSVLLLLLLGQPFCYTVLATETTTTSTTSQRSNAYFLNKKNKNEHYVTAVVVESSEFQSQQEQEQQIDTNELVDNERSIVSSLKHSRRIRRRISSHMEMSDDVDEDEQQDEDNTNEDGTVDDMEDMMMSNHVTNLSTGGTIVLLFVCGIICFWLTYLCLQKYDTQKDAPSHECDDDDDVTNHCKVQNDSTMLAFEDIDTKSNTTNETTIERYHSSTKTNDIL